MIEDIRFIRAVETEFIGVLKDKKQFDKLFPKYIQYYFFKRPRYDLKMLTPAQYIKKKLLKK